MAHRLQLHVSVLLPVLELLGLDPQVGVRLGESALLGLDGLRPVLDRVFLVGQLVLQAVKLNLLLLKRPLRLLQPFLLPPEPLLHLLVLLLGGLIL